MSKFASKFDYLLNAFELASQSKHPAAEGYADKRRALLDYVRDLERSRYVGDVSLFKDRTAKAAAWQCAMMFAQATEWLITVREDGWKHLPLYLKNPLGEQVRTLVYHARDLNVQPKGLGGAELPRLAYALATPGFYGEPVDKRICESSE